MNTAVINTSILTNNKTKPVSRPSIETVTTSGESSSDSFHCEERIMHVPPKCKHSSPKKTSKSHHHHSKGKSTDKESKKDILKKTVKKEMMNALQPDDNDEEEKTPIMETHPISSADLFYAMMNGEEFKPSDFFSELQEEEPQDNNDDDDDDDNNYLDIDDDDKTNTFDQKSFAALVFKDEEVLMEKKDKRNSVNRISLSTDDSSRSQSSYSSTSNSGSDVMSVREIEEFVMDNMPKHVRDAIPKEAWGKIFGQARADKIRKSSKTIDGQEQEEEKEEAEIEDDNVSIISAVTEATEYKVAKHGFVTTNDIPTNVSTSSSHECKSANPCRVDFSGQVVVAEKKDRPKRENLSVSFDSVRVRYYERIIDINPAVTNGAAVGIGWRYKRGGKFDIEEWESNRMNTRRSKELLLPKHVREAMLKDLGYTQQDIAAAVRVILKAKNNRRQTVQNLGAESMEEAVEAASRRVKSILTLGMKNGLVKV